MSLSASNAARRLVAAVPTTERRGLAFVDPTLLMTVVALCSFGLVMVYSASDALGYLWYGNVNYFFEHQVLWLILGLVGMGIASRIDYHLWSKLAPKLITITLAALVLVLIPHIGTQVSGARRWFVFGPISLQPSDMAALGGVLFMARWLVSRHSSLHDWHCVRDYLVLVALVLGLVMLEKDMSTTIILGCVALAMLAAAGARWRHLFSLAGMAVGAGIIAIVIEPYRLARWVGFLSPFAHAQTNGFQTVQSMLALGSGGVTGLGLGNSIQKYDWLPQAHTDFIFAIIGEELGLIGTISVLVAFLFLAWRGIATARRAQDGYGSLVAVGITVWVCAEAFLNMAAVTGLVPATGVPLPFISYGGSSLATDLVGIGILFNISALGGRRAGVVERATVDSWRRNGGAPDARSGSRARGTAS